MKRKSLLYISILSILLVIGIFSGYAVGKARLSLPGIKSQSVGEITSEEADRGVQEISGLRDRLLKVDSQGGSVDAAIEFLNPVEDDNKYLVFKAQFNTHSVDLDQYDFGKMTTFKTGDGLELREEIIWEKAEGEGHHYLGYYKIPKAAGGNPVITKDTEFVEINISGLDNISNRSFKWEEDVLKLIRKD